MKNLTTYFLVLLLGTAFISEARERPADRKAKQRKGSSKVLMENCAPATAEIDLSINNVRARILGSGDMWWDLNNAKYEVPKGSDRHSMFAGALWLGGYDEADQLKMAAMTYRSGGVDFWPGPLSEDNTASTESSTCEKYNRHWLLHREDVETHAAWIACKEDPGCNVGERFPGYQNSVPESIREWPGNGIDGEFMNKLAPYFESEDNGTPGLYDWEWDYPAYDLAREFNCQLKEVDLLYGDETIWWVYNDKGNVHTETQGAALGFEIRAQSFAFTSNDEINNMTFNNYRILNKSTFRLKETFFGTWFDPDLGQADDDIIGCDISRGLGYCYNGDLDDDGPNGYGLNPPAVAFDFFQGPFADYFDGVDNDRDGCVDGIKDELGECLPEDPSIGRNERIIMSGFMYYNNGSRFSGSDALTDPDIAEEYYNYLNSRWKDGNPLIIENPSGKGNNLNGDGYSVNGIAAGERTYFAYPGLSYDTTGAFKPDEPLANGGWWEAPGNSADKRGLHCAGPFSLAPGALNFITTGTVWARNFSGQDLFSSVADVIVADDKAQQLFDNCFQILDGPTSPLLEIVELDGELILNLKNVYNDDVMGYEQKDPLIPVPDGWTAAEIAKATEDGYFSYRFEGFQIFQVAGPDVTIDKIYDTEQARLIAQCDLKNDIGQLVNYTVREDLVSGSLDPQDMTIEAANDGIKLSFSIKEDEFATGNRALVNHREYYFYVLAYSQNQFIEFDPRNMSDDANAQKTPYLAGRKIGNGQKPYLGIPHKTESESRGTKLNANHGDQVQITRLSGAGTGDNFLRLNAESEESIAFNYREDVLKYEPAGGPFELKVVDPKAVMDGDYIISFNGTSPESKWYVYPANDPSNIIDSARFGLAFQGEQIIEQLGVSVSFINQGLPGQDTLDAYNNGVIGAEMTFSDPQVPWLSGVPDDDTFTPRNWINAGAANVTTDVDDRFNAYPKASTLDPQDPRGHFQTLLNGTWAPAAFTSDVAYDPTSFTSSNIPILGLPIRTGSFDRMYPVSQIGNVDVVFTSDHTKWTRCPVLEMGNVATNNQGGGEQFDLRKAPTLDLTADGRLVPNNSKDSGWSYFPGYAINVETGRRLNMAFGENSWFKSDNGDDMLWNPTSNLARALNGWRMGGMHTIYVFADSVASGVGQYIDLTYAGDDIEAHPLKDVIDLLENSLRKQFFFGSMYWASLPLTTPGFEFKEYSQIPTEARVSLRMGKPYQVVGGGINDGNPQYQFSMDGLQPSLNDLAVAKSALDAIKVVPNPYYGSSQYEGTQLDNVVKITNLPERCRISILMSNGTIIRTIQKDNSLTYAEWDLKNDFNVPIASGVYLIHVDAGSIGEKVVKWMGAMRPVDLNAF